MLCFRLVDFSLCIKLIQQPIVFEVLFALLCPPSRPPSPPPTIGTYQEDRRGKLRCGWRRICIRAYFSIIILSASSLLAGEMNCRKRLTLQIYKWKSRPQDVSSRHVLPVAVPDLKPAGG